ncbi:MAG: transglycosylase SLT domain-containing protein [Syntrophales bacterium]
MKTILKFTLSFLTAAGLVLCAAPYFDPGGQSSLDPKPYNETVRRAITKSVRWAKDEEILRLAMRAERKYGRQIEQISRRYGTNPQEIKAIAIVESLMDEAAKSSEGAIGLMGVKRTTGMEMGFSDVEHPVRNISAGTKYYRMLLGRFKDRDLALAAYNLGPAKLENRLGSGFDPEEMQYIWKIRRVVHIINRSEAGKRPAQSGRS